MAWIVAGPAPSAPPPGPAPANLPLAPVVLHLDAQTFQLSNGMRFWLVPDPHRSFVAAGWVAHVGSADDPPGRSGLSHLLEHLLFQGSRTIGTRDFSRERALLDEQEELRLAERKPGPDNSAPSSPADRSKELEAALRALQVPDEFDRLYSQASASAANAFTTVDLTAYFVSVPANKLELWFWLESDRLVQPVFRGFGKELEVIAEEHQRRLSAPTGSRDERVEDLFWQDHPYHAPRLGWPGEVAAFRRLDAEEHFRAFYGPNNLTAVLVGPVQVATARALAERYFGRLEPRTLPAPRGSRAAPSRTAELRLELPCPCPPAVELRYPTVGSGHEDAYSLDLLAALLGGPAGRLEESLVRARGRALRATASQTSYRQAGYFSLVAEPAAGVSLEELVADLDTLVGELGERQAGDDELRQARNHLLNSSLRQLEDPFALMIQLLVHAGQDQPRFFEEAPRQWLAVDPERLQRTALSYLRRQSRTVVLTTRPAAETR
ncbi:MAG: pitrilysin family protein [Thermoanaerobaculia bacterium]